MSAKQISEKLPPFARGRPILLGLGALLAIGVLGFLLFRPSQTQANANDFFKVRRGDFTVSVIEGGTLGAVNEVVVRSEVEGTARIVNIVPEGSYVKKGDLLVELDSSQAQDQLNQQEIATEKAKFAVEQAEAQLEIMRSATNSDWMAAELKYKLAQLDLEKYDQGLRLVNFVEASNKVVQVRAQLEVNLDNYRNSTNLAAKGYETQQKVQSDLLGLLNTQNSLIVASNQMWMLERFDIFKTTKQLEADVAQAKQELDRTLVQNRRRMAQYEADLVTQQNTLRLNEQKLERDKRNLDATKIPAPSDGLVVYQVSENRFSSESLIEGGAVVRNRQELIKLPDLSRMKVVVKIHESHINLIRPGLPAYVVLDSAPDQRYPGVVERVAPLPDTQARWGNPNLKVYNTEVVLTETPPNVRPGVSAKAEIVITNIGNAISVPIQAVTTLKNRQVVYVSKGGKTEPRPIEVGMFNTKFIEIAKGLNDGESIWLTPPFDSQSKDLEGGVLAQDEKAKLAPTNAPVAPTPPAGPSGTPGGPPNVGPVASANGGSPSMGAPAGGPGAQPGQGGQRPGFNREEMMKRFDKNGDGQLDDEERNAMRQSFGGGPGGPGAGGGGGFNREEMMKRFDKNGDGQIDEEERNAMRQSFGGSRGQGGQGGQQEGEGGGRRQRQNRDGQGERPQSNPTAGPGPTS